MASVKFWVWLASVGEPTAAWKVYEYFGDAEKAYFAGEEEYRQIPGLKAAQMAPFLNKEYGSRLVSKIMADCKRLGVHISAFESADYPQRLRGIDVPPLVLYLLGRPVRLEEECVVAMAGTRRCSEYGQAMSQRFASELTREGALVLTGVAGGCDEAAVVGALQAGGPVAVLLPGGVDVPFEETDFYRQFYRDIQSFGTLISAYPPGTPNDHRHFHYRNTILTGLSVVTLVMEAPIRSGTLNVASCAGDQGRTVYTIPANLDSLSAAGTNGLLCSGLALPVMSAEDILATYRSSFPRLRVPRAVKGTAWKAGKGGSVKKNPQISLHTIHEEKADLTPSEKASAEKKVDTAADSDYIDLNADKNRFTDDERDILLALQGEARTTEELTTQTGMPSNRAMAALTMLTLRSCIRELDGGRFESAVRVKG